jgi:hypothetical protein
MGRDTSPAGTHGGVIIDLDGDNDGHAAEDDEFERY